MHPLSTPTTFEHDKLNRKDFEERFEKFIMVDHDFVDGSLVVSLNAPFGSGKTSFLSMWKDDLDKRREKGANLPKVIMLNAWESDYCGDPLLSIVIKLAQSVETKNTDQKTSILEAVKDFGNFTLALANGFVAHSTGLNSMEAGKHAQDEKQKRSEQKLDIVKLYEEKEAALQKLKEALRKAFASDNPKAFVFVDELDRCRPDYAVSYLETIKHVFDIHGLVFVLGIDYDQLSGSARALFGQDLNFPEYFRKFVHRSVSLPELDLPRVQMLADHYVRNYLVLANKRSSLLEINYRVKNLVELVCALRMTPRQIQEAFRIIGHVTSERHDLKKELPWSMSVGIILMVIFKITRPHMYVDLGKDLEDPQEMGNFFKKYLGLKNAEWWCCIYVTGAGKKTGNSEEWLKGLNFTPADQSGSRDLGQFSRGWGWQEREQSSFVNLYNRIESVTTFSN
jgi:hypothetical protein